MVKLNDQGLAPAIIQDVATKEVLMLAWVNPDSLKRTLESGDVWFYSRSREELWHKGEVSGHFLHLKAAWEDCDADTFLFQVQPEGPACHTGNISCFFTPLEALPAFQRADAGSGILEELFAIVQERQRELPEGSYTAELLKAGRSRVAQKVIEEAGEAALAAVEEGSDRLAQEVADLLYHALVLLASADTTPEAVWQALRERRGG